MFGGKRFSRRWLHAVTGFLLAVISIELVHDFVAPNLPSLFEPQVVEAALLNIDPDGEGTIQGADTTCATTANNTCLDDAVRSPTAPSTAGDYVQFNRNQGDYYTMGTIANVSSVSSITIYMYHVEGNTGHQFQVGLYDAAQTTQYGTTQNVTIRTTAQWDSVTISGLSLSQAQLDGLRVRTLCTRPGTGNFWCRDYAMYAAVTYTELINVTVGTTGTQQNLDAGTTGQHIGGAFSIQGTNGSRNVTSVTISETGTVNGSTNLDNISLYYKTDTSAPYDCASEPYSGSTLWGSVDADGFSGADGSSTFSGTSVGISPTISMCVYVVLDVLSSAGAGETIEVQITSPQTEVVASGSPVITPASAVAISGATTIQKTVLTQENYHWRNDNGNETGATSATGGSENTAYTSFPKGIVKRVRFAVSNEGNKTSAATQYRLEYAQKVSTCSAASGWTDVGAGGGDFDMSNTGNFTDGDNTTNISVASGGVSDPNTTFLTPNAGMKDTSSQTGNITLTSTEYVEVEYAIVGSTGITDGTSYCFRVTSSGTEIQTYTRYAEATVAADILVTSSGSLTSSVTIPQTNQYAGGTFVIDDQLGGSNSVTSIKIKAAGTVDAENMLTNVRLRYDVDASAPYDCSGETYASGDTQFGVDGSFNASKEATFTDTETVDGTHSMCVYVVYTASSSIINGQTLTLSINNASTDVVAGSASVAPNSAVNMGGTTTFVAPYVRQTGYHWRNNDGSEAAATSATGGTENTAFVDFPKSTNYRLRFGVANTGGASAASVGYRLEYAQKVSTCGAATGWARIDTGGDAWDMTANGNLTDGADTTNISVATGGVSNGAATFVSTNGGVKESSDETAGVVIPDDDYLELEYSITANTNAVQGATYCFRVTAAGTALNLYDNYAEATIKLDTDFKIQRDFETMTGTTLTITAGVDYDAPVASTSAFIRITNTQLTGAGPNTGAGNSNANDVTVYITNPSNIMNSITFARTGTGGNTRISWEIVEYKGVSGGENEIIVRGQGIITYGAGNTTANSPTLTGVVTDADVVPFITGQQNPDAGRTNYHLGLSTSAWSSSNDQVALTRAASGNAGIVSYAAVEFTGSNWKIQRTEHTYSAVGATETNSITAVNSLSRAFLHTQKRTTQNNHADFGHEVWLSGIGQVSFALDGAAASAANHTSVAWVIENTQTQGLKMDVTRSSASFNTTGTSPQANNVTISPALTDLSIASIFANNRSDGGTRTWPEPIMGARIISLTQYELWRSDISNNIAYRTEIVEWPTAARKITQNYYRLYADNNALKPTDPWPVGGTNLGENTEMTANDDPIAPGETIRLRMTLAISAAAQPATLDSFDLEYAPRVTTCSAISTWYSIGDIGSTTAAWRGVANTPADGTALSGEPPTGGDLLISVADVAGTYEEQNSTALNPFTAFPGEDVEYDWVIQHNAAEDKTSYCFRMAEADGTSFFGYNNYPVIRTVGYEPLVTNWRWYEDETNATPSSPRANENVAPSNMEFDNAFKLRLVLRESSGANGNNVKFALQYSEYADFSQEVHTVTSTSTCAGDSLWCYYDGAGVDNATINSAVISNADTCSGGVGAGCGTYNEGTSTANATLDQTAYTDTEFEFTVKHDGARSNAVYYFRLYNLTYDEVVGVAPTFSYPSLVTEGAALNASMGGISAGTSIAGITTDVLTTASAISFGSLPFNTDYEAAQQISIDTNATEGYQLLAYGTQDLLNTYGDPIPPVTGTNASPAGWNTVCNTGVQAGCFGYHTTDATLFNGSTRFSPTDSYAALDSTPREIMYSSIPTADIENIVYRIKITADQPAGDYTADIVYIAVPVH
ncbi:MAG: hypothetical protein RL538_207 [Candidatus Parcubacteria bacterium]|jgi:hypothetical protein